MTMTRDLKFDAVVLAGGTGARLGGVSKPDVQLDGHRLLDRVLASLGNAEQVVVVGDVAVPENVWQTVEHPIRSGPAAGVAAGLAALPRHSDWTMLLSCDLAAPGNVVAALLRGTNPEQLAVTGWCLSGSGGFPQWLASLHRTDALINTVRDFGDPTNRGLRLMFADSPPELIDVDDSVILDIDTWEDHLRATAGLTEPGGRDV